MILKRRFHKISQIFRVIKRQLDVPAVVVVNNEKGEYEWNPGWERGIGGVKDCKSLQHPVASRSAPSRRLLQDFRGQPDVKTNMFDIKIRDGGAVK